MKSVADFIREARDWVVNTYPSVEAIDENFYANLLGIILLFQIIGGIGLFFIILQPLSNFIIKAESEAPHRIELPDVPASTLIKKALLYSFLFCAPGALIMSPVLLLCPLSIAGVMVVLLFSQAFGILILLWRMGKNADLSMKDLLKRPFQGARTQLLRHIGLGTILAAILYIILYLSFGLNYIGWAPGISKIPWVPIYFAANIFTILILGLFSQLVLQPKLKNSYGPLKTILITFGVIMIYICTVITLPCIVMGNYFIMIFLYIVTPLAFLTSVVCVVLYQKTGNIISATIVNATYLTLIMCTLAPFIFLLFTPLSIISM